MVTIYGSLSRPRSQTDSDVTPPRLYVVKDSSAKLAEEEAGLAGEPPRESKVAEAPSKRRRRISGEVVPADWQFALPFGEKLGQTIVIVPMERMNGPSFRDLLKTRSPAAAVDLRALIRFDLPGTSREDIFRAMSAQKTHYVKDPLPWHDLDARAWATLDAPVSNALVHEISERKAECVFVLVYRHAEAQSIAVHLNRVLSQRLRTPWRVEEVG